MKTSQIINRQKCSQSMGVPGGEEECLVTHIGCWWMKMITNGNLERQYLIAIPNVVSTN